MTAITSERPPLGVGRIVGHSFSLFLANLPSFVPLAVLPVLLVNLIVALQTGDLDTSSGLEATGTSNGDGRNTGTHVIQGFGHSLAAAFLTLAVRDASVGVRRRMADLFGAIGANVVYILICPTVANLFAVLAGLVGILPGLWLSAVWWVIVPVALFEASGFGSFGRSAVLTKGYRWPIIGLFLLLLTCTAIPLVPVVIYVGYPETTLLRVAWYILMSGLIGCAGGLISVSAALTYARLREIKEGGGPESLTAVFA